MYHMPRSEHYAHASHHRARCRPGLTQRQPAADKALFEAMPATLRPNIAVTVSGKRPNIPRGPRITWLNHAISLYLEYIGARLLRLAERRALLQVRPCCPSLATYALAHAIRKAS